tara:strand:- start:70 stop:600 length:531 start_codon:yes stop_codon:yes gene_type:complete
MEFIILTTLFIITTNKLASIYAHEKSLLIKEPYKALPDILHNILPVIHVNIPDYLLLLLFLQFMFTYTGEYNYEPLLYSLLLRPLFVISTTLPTCMKCIDHKELSYYNQLFVSSHDLIYSGHTLFFLFFGKSYGGNIGLTIQYIMPISLISSRQHYTIDVLVSFIVYNYFEIYSMK